MRVHELAEAIGAPAPYLSKIIHELTRKGYFDATRGKGGGVALGVDPRKVTLFDLCEALNDNVLHPSCALGIAECSDARACPAHELQKAVRAKQLAFLRSTTVHRIGEFNAAHGHARHGATPATVSPTRKGART